MHVCMRWLPETKTMAAMAHCMELLSRVLGILYELSIDVRQLGPNMIPMMACGRCRWQKTKANAPRAECRGYGISYPTAPRHSYKKSQGLIVRSQTLAAKAPERLWSLNNLRQVGLLLLRIQSVHESIHTILP